jgi:hypothetical protein
MFGFFPSSINAKAELQLFSVKNIRLEKELDKDWISP